MRKYSIMLGLLAVISFGCQNNKTTSSNVVESNIKEINVDKGSKFFSMISKKAGRMIANDDYISFDELQTQKLDRIEENSEITADYSKPALKSGNEIYYYLKDRTFLVGSSYLY